MKLLTMSQNNQPVYESQATYYNPVSKRWKEGLFRLKKSYFEFIIESQNEAEQFHLSLPMNTISNIEKRQSSFIYSAVVVTVGSEKHWFASFPNRDTVYNLMELFWRGALLSNTYKTTTTVLKSANNSKLGKELLNLLYDSENTLLGAANALADQGRQIEDTEETVEEIKGDLTVAEKLIKSMEYLPTLPFISRASIKQTVKDDCSKVGNSELRQKHYKITFSQTKNSNEQTSNWEKGTLVICDEISILDGNGSRQLHVPIDQLRNVQVVSPWELQLNYAVNVEEDSCNIMCTQLSSLLKFVSSIPAFKNKVIYDNEDASIYGTPCSSTSSMHSTLASPSSPVVALPNEEMAENQTSVQNMQDLLSDNEVMEISHVLNNLHALAAEVGKEQKSQIEKINALISDIDNTALRINANDKKVKKLN